MSDAAPRFELINERRLPGGGRFQLYRREGLPLEVHVIKKLPWSAIEVEVHVDDDIRTFMWGEWDRIRDALDLRERIQLQEERIRRGRRHGAAT